MPQLRKVRMTEDELAVKFLEDERKRSERILKEQKKIKLRADGEPMPVSEFLASEACWLLKCITGIAWLEYHLLKKQWEKYDAAVRNVEAQIDGIFEEHSREGTLITCAPGQKEIAVKSIIGLYSVPGLICIDILDIFRCIRNAKRIAVGVSEVFTGEGRGANAARGIISRLNDHFNDCVISDVIFNVQGDQSMTLYEVNDAAEEIYKIIDEQANIMFGATVDAAKNGIRIALLLAERE